MSAVPSEPLLPGPVGVFATASEALAEVRRVYDHNTAYLRGRFSIYASDADWTERASAHYPYIRFSTQTAGAIDSRLSYGFLGAPGVYATTLTRPDLFEGYYLEQLSLLLRNHGGVVEVGVSTEPIPIHFAYPEGIYVEGDLTPERLAKMPDAFDLPDLARMDDMIVNGTFTVAEGVPEPLALFTAPRVDFSLHRLRHYTGTDPADFQNFVLFTNYQFYVDEFVRWGQTMMAATDDPSLAAQRRQYDRFVEPGGNVFHNRNRPDWEESVDIGAPRRMPQMPAYHLTRPDGNGITLVNIGVGPSNAKTITDHIAVLRPHAWIMLGHCAGLRGNQRLGDYVLAHGYVRDDHVLDADLPTWVPVPALAEIQRALETAVERITGLTGYQLKTVMRTGTVATIDNRNWELHSQRGLFERFSQSRAIALDMESATIAANGFRFRVPYGTLLCVSDKPMHGQLKLPGMADAFYRERVDQHLQIGVLAMEFLREEGMETLHSRKLRSFAEVPFR